MNNDPLANVMSKMLNYERIGRDSVRLYPVARMTKKVLDLLQANGFVGECAAQNTTRGAVITVPLLGKINECGVVKPRFAITSADYDKWEKRYLPAKGFGIIIISTSKGLMILEDAKKQNIGGRLIAYCY